MAGGAACLGLRARDHRAAAFVDAQVHRRLAPALAHRLQLDERVGEAEQRRRTGERAEEHTSELQSLMRISYAVFGLKKKKKLTNIRAYLNSAEHILNQPGHHHITLCFCALSERRLISITYINPR